MIFESTAESAPQRNPDSAPRYIPAMTTIAVTGLKCGRAEKANLPSTESATITASISILPVPLFFSNAIKNGTQERTATQMESQTYALLPAASVPIIITAGTAKSSIAKRRIFFFPLIRFPLFRER